MVTLLIVASVLAQKLPAGPMELHARELTVEPHGQRVTAIGDVVVHRGDATVRCDRAVAVYTMQERASPATGGGQRPQRPTAGRDLSHLEASGHVFLERGTARAQADAGSFDGPTGIYALTGHARAERGADWLTGERLLLHDADDDLEATQAEGVLRTVPSSLKPGGDQAASLHFSADRLVAHEQGHRTELLGHVVLTRGALTIHASSLEAVAGDDGAVRTMHLAGDVQLARDQRRATARQADYSATDGLLWLSGAPEIHDGDDTVRGQRIGYALESGDVRVEQAVARVQERVSPGSGGGQRPQHPVEHRR